MARRKWGSDYAKHATKRSHGIADADERSRAYSEFFLKHATARALKRGVTVKKRKATPAEVRRTRSSGTRLLRALPTAFASMRLEATASAVAGYPPLQAAKDVAYVIGQFKNRDPNTIAAADPLTKYHFELDEKRAMAILLDDFYLDRGYSMNEPIQPHETEGATYVAHFIAVVLKPDHNPHR